MNIKGYPFLVKKNLCYLPFANKLITNRSIQIQKRKLRDLENFLNRENIKMVGPKDFKYISPRNYSHCNIWGSGTSAAISVKNNRFLKNAFNIGIGFSYLLNIDFNFYFIENASQSQNELVVRQKRGLLRFVDLENCPLILKNLTQDKNDISYALNKYKEIAYFGKDLPISHYLNNLRTFNYSTDLLLKKDGDYFRQACSTVITSIIFAKYLGFKKIILHGVDFFGGYFFDQNEYKNLSEFHPPYFEKNIVKGSDIYNKEWRDEKGNHPTSNCLYKFIPILKNKLKIENVELYSAVEESPLSNILELYS